MRREFNEFPKIGRYSREVIVTEKIDGTNASICITDEGEFLTSSRSRWITPEDDNFGFSRWAHDHKEELLTLGVGHHFGEWWGSGIQRKYGKSGGDKVFSLFNVHRWGETRPECCSVVPVLWRGLFDDMDLDDIMSDLYRHGSYAAPGFKKPEGIIIFHTAAGVCFKKTFEKDAGKGN